MTCPGDFWLGSAVVALSVSDVNAPLDPSSNLD
jgi:hypothetical protein